MSKFFQSKVLQGPPSPDLPSYRVASEFAFTKIGLDHVGPILVKNIYVDKNDMHKAYTLSAKSSSAESDEILVK